MSLSLLIEIPENPATLTTESNILSDLIIKWATTQNTLAFPNPDPLTLAAKNYRKCTNSSIGIPPRCSGKLHRTVNFQTAESDLNWQESVDNCRSQRSVLFHSLIGTSEQLLFLLNMLGLQTVLVDVRYDTMVKTWLNLKGHDVMALKVENPILWAPNESSTYTDGSVLVVE